MFTGIVEQAGIINTITDEGGNRQFWISSPLTPELKIDQSLSHNGVCLTVDALKNQEYRVTAVAETLTKSNAKDWNPGDYINLERAMVMNGRLDGHLVQGHVDATATCTGITDKKGSWEFQFRFPREYAHLVIEKGSIAVNGISLTAWNVDLEHFTVAIIPYTYHHTNLRYLKPGQTVNLEFDMIGKYIHRFQQVTSSV